MKHNLAIELLLLVIIVLLTVNLIRPLVSPSTTHAAPSIQYKGAVIEAPADQLAQALESALNDHAKDGWELVTVSLGSILFLKK